MRCTVCGLAAHDNPQRGEHVGNDCFTKLHNDHCTGLAITVIAKYSKLMRTSGECRQTTTEKKIASKRSSGSSHMLYVDAPLQLKIVGDSIKE
jgi:hypothetical protein